MGAASRVVIEFDAHANGLCFPSQLKFYGVYCAGSHTC